MNNRYPPLTTLSLVKSRQMLQKISSNIDSIEPNRENSMMVQSIQTSAHKIQQTLDTKIEQNFITMLNSPTLMPLDIAKAEGRFKENKLPTNTTALQGSKALMYHYWDRNKKSASNTLKKSNSVKQLESRKSENKLPNINQSHQDIKMLVKMKQKEQEFNEFSFKKPEPKEEYHIKIKIVEFKCQNESKSFFKFQKTYFKRWKEIETIIKALQRFAEYYNVRDLTVNSKEVFQLIDRASRGSKTTTHDLLGCCQNAEQISQENCNQAGIRFYGNSGKLRAVVFIQARIRRWLAQKNYKLKMLEWRSAAFIQSHFRCYLLQKAMKKKLFDVQLQKIDKFNSIQKAFSLNYRRKQLQSRIKYEIHIPSHNYSEWQKVSMQKYNQKQNNELCRIFKIAESNPTCDVRIIYVSPIALTKEIMNYYKKLMQLASDEELKHKLIVMTPEYSDKLPVNLSLAQVLYYSNKTLNKIKKIIKNNYAYIVPSTPSNVYIHLCNYLNVPLYGSNPQKLTYLSSKAGCKSFQECLTEKDGQEGVGVLPYSVDIYSESSLLNQLTNLIYRYPYVRRWVLKIDNEQHSRGIAYLDISKILGKTFTRMNRQNKKGETKPTREDIFGQLQNSLVTNKEERIVTVDKETYPSQAQYLQYFYTRGGIIEASIDNFQSDLENMCFCIDLQPHGEWNFLCSYYKITNKNKTVGAYYNEALIKPPLQIENIIRKLKTEKLFGYFTLEFLSINHSLEKTMKKSENKVYYLNSIDCHLNQFSAAHYLRQLISKNSNALFMPMIQHPAIKDLRMQTFFHLCRLQNISFDMEKKVGNVFTFMDGLESGCLGIMTFNESSREDCYQHTAEVLDFLNCKLRQTNNLKDVPSSFYQVKNAVNGFLNRTKKQKMRLNRQLERA